MVTVAIDNLPQTLSYFVYNKLRRRIITGDLRPGQVVREQELETQYGSSRGPIRESLRMLLQTGLVEHQERRGFRVRSYTPRDIENIYQLRAALEELVVSSLEGLQLEPLIKTLKLSCQVMESCYDKRDVQGYFDENAVFHQKIIDFTENRPLSQVIFYVNEISLPPRYKLLSETFPTRRSLTYHEQITRFIEINDLAAAKRVTREHILENLGRATAAFFAEAH